jgi:hypothetical protein
MDKDATKLCSGRLWQLLSMSHNGQAEHAQHLPTLRSLRAAGAAGLSIAHHSRLVAVK